MTIAIMTVVCFALGAVWHSTLFGKLWMRIHHGDRKISDVEMKEESKNMWKLLIPEFIATFLMIVGLACIIRAIPQYSGVQNAFLVWLAFVMPAITSSILWGNDKKSVMPIKIIISASYRLIGLLATGYVLSSM
jgi:glycerol uptake facilitator-like aquaporin